MRGSISYNLSTMERKSNESAPSHATKGNRFLAGRTTAFPKVTYVFGGVFFGGEEKQSRWTSSITHSVYPTITVLSAFLSHFTQWGPPLLPSSPPTPHGHTSSSGPGASCEIRGNSRMHPTPHSSGPQLLQDAGAKLTLEQASILSVCHDLPLPMVRISPLV